MRARVQLIAALSVIASTFGLAGCGNAPAPVLAGEITSETVDRTLRGLNAERPKVVVRSAGGDPVAAIRFANALRERDAEVIVDDYCLAACAQFVAIGVPKLTIRPSALVGFHNSVEAGARLALDEGRELDDRLTAQAQRDAAVYRAWGVDEAVLLDQFTGLSALCLTADPAGRPIYRARAQFWIPPRDWMERARGATVSGWWPEKQEDLLIGIRSVRSDLPGLGSFRFGEAEAWAMASARLRQVSC